MTAKNESVTALPHHPRLFCSVGDLARLRELRADGVHARIWRNLAESAGWCLQQEPRRHWIAPVSPDPVYANLYDRFYAAMRDAAITEHLGFAYAISGDCEFGEAARRWVLAGSRVWRNEAHNPPDGGKAYAVSRILKGIAVGYDLAFDRLSEEERTEVREMLREVGHLYYTSYFTAPETAGPGFHTHHAIVEFGSLGVAALALLDEVPEATLWLDLTVKKFQQHLLPTGLASDGAQTEGATFWASTMHYRLFFMDALRRVTGHDLFHDYGQYMNGDLALATIAAQKHAGWNENQQTVVMSPSYGQLDYVSPVLLCLAREYRRPIHQYLALWDHSLGHIQKTRYLTPNGEQLLFELGGYSYVWYDSTVPARPDEDRLSYQFPSVNEVYARASWEPGGLLIGVCGGRTVVHAGGRAVMVDVDAPAAAAGQADRIVLEDDGRQAAIRCGEGLTVLLQRPDRLTIRRRTATDVRWWCHGEPARDGNALTWPGGTAMLVRKGTIVALDEEGHSDEKIVGMGKLRCPDPMPAHCPLITARPDGGELRIDVSVQPERRRSQ